MSPTIRLRGRREPVGAQPVRVHVRGIGDRRQLVFAAAYVRRLLARTTGRIEIVVSPGTARSGLSSGEISRALPEDPLISYVRRTDPRRRGTRTVLLSMDGAPLGAYLRLLGAERRRAWVVVWEPLAPLDGLVPPRRRGAAMVADALAPARSAKNAVLTDQQWALARRDRSEPTGWRLNEDVAGEFRRLVKRSGTPRRAAVYLAAPWPADLGEQQARLTEVEQVRAACAEAGLTLQVRPATDAEGAPYGDHTLTDVRAPAELDPRVVDATLAVGEPSLALLLLAAVHGVPSIALARDEDSLAQGRRRSCFDAWVPTRARATSLAPRLARPTR